MRAEAISRLFDLVLILALLVPNFILVRESFTEYLDNKTYFSHSKERELEEHAWCLFFYAVAQGSTRQVARNIMGGGKAILNPQSLLIPHIH